MCEYGGRWFDEWLDHDQARRRFCLGALGFVAATVLVDALYPESHPMCSVGSLEEIQV